MLWYNEAAELFGTKLCLGKIFLVRNQINVCVSSCKRCNDMWMHVTLLHNNTFGIAYKGDQHLGIQMNIKADMKSVSVLLAPECLG